ncbi:MAG: DMT family transporter [Alphaproteobacteria bacterium]|nr:DMT family transporter [Alphaproteobacteria bacterium]
MTSEQQRQHQIGLALVAMAALAWSTAGIFARAISADLMTMLFVRGLFSGTGVLLLFFLIEGRAAFAILRSLRWPALAVACLSACGMITGIGSFRFTSVANAMVIYATVPFITAGMAYLAIGERPTASTLVASLVALAGVIVMLSGSDWGGGLFGMALAIIMTFCMAGFTTVMRAHREVPMLPAMGFSAWLCASFCFWFATPLGMSGQDLMLTAMFGIFQNAAGLAFYTFGSKRIPAAEATLLAALEVPLTPLWVFLLMSETPGPETLIGGGIVMIALFGHIVLEFRGRTRPDPEPFQAAP